MSPSSVPDADQRRISEAGLKYATASPLANTRGAEYLATRGIGIEIAESAGVRFARDFYGRPAVLFPLCDRNGELVAVNGRYVDGRSDPRTRIAGVKKLGLFASPGALDAARIVICEAPIDALSLAICGVPTLALAGTSGPDWLGLAIAFRPVALAFDADAAGDAAGETWGRAYRKAGIRVERWRPTETGTKDWNGLLLVLGLEPLRAMLERKGVRVCATPDWSIESDQIRRI